MGLDMYLTGEKYYPEYTVNNRDIQKVDRPQSDGFPLRSNILALGYWRKHPNLHGFIVNNFADGIDDCSPINLNSEDLGKIAEALRKWELPETEGFFFGTSEDHAEQKDQDADLFAKVKAWLEENQENVEKSVVYEASW